MPQYEFLCHSCHKAFVTILTIAEHEKEEPIKCTHCGSTNIEQIYSAFYAVTSKRSA
jgi:putative FmdB family regulatory protein